MGKIRDFISRTFNGGARADTFFPQYPGFQVDGNGQWLESANRGGGRRKSVYAENLSIRELISPFDRDTVVSVSNRLYANNGLVRGAIDDKALHTCRDAFRPISMATDRAWAKEAEKWLMEQWFPQCEDGASDISFNDGCFLESVSMDREGDIGIVPVYRADGYPLIRHIPAHRMKQRNWSWTGRNGMGIQGDYGPFKGAWLYDGVVMNDFGRPLAYFVRGREEQYDRYVPTRSMTLLREPCWFDQVRGYPLFFHALNEIRESKQAKEAELRALNQAGTRSLVYTTETGLPPNPGDPGQYGTIPVGTDADGNVNTVTYQRLEDGTLTYQAAGEDVKMLEHDRPAENWRVFFDRVRKEAMAGQTWPDELIYEIAKTNTNAIRLILDKAQAAKDDRFNLLRPVALMKIRHAIVGAMDLGILPWNEEWYIWGVSRPKDSTIDRGRDGKNLREDFLMGIINLGTMLAKTTGETVEEHWRTRYTEEAIRLQMKAEVEAQYGVTLDDAKVYQFGDPPAPPTGAGADSGDNAGGAA